MAGRAAERAGAIPRASMTASPLETLAERVNANAALVARGRFLDTTFLIEVGGEPYYVSVAGGRIAAVEKDPRPMRPWSFAVRASAEAWERFWAPVPAPGWHDIFAMTKSGAMTIEGDLGPLMANLRYLKEVLAAPRRGG